MAWNRRKNIKVFIRILPSEDISYNVIKIEPDFKVINVQSPQSFTKGYDETKSCYWSFPADNILYNTSQEKMYEIVLEGVIEKLLAGINVIVMCYGQTGSGKSFSANALHNHFIDRGLVPRLINDLFDKKVKLRDDQLMELKMSFVELFGEKLKDLLPSRYGCTQTSVYDPIKNVSIARVESEEEAMSILFEGENRRTCCDGAPYPSSNLGNSIFTIHVENTSLLISQAPTTQATVHVLDMAGIDTAGKLTSNWKEPREIGKANITKSTLQQILSRLDSPADVSASDRHSLMVRYLGNALSKQSAIVMLGHIRADRENLDITLSTLRFGSKASKLGCSKKKITEKPKRDSLLETMEEEIVWLRDRVELCAMLDSQTDWKRELSPNRASRLVQITDSFIKGETRNISICSVAQSLATMQRLREVYSMLKLSKVELEQKLQVLEKEAREKLLSQPSEHNLIRKASKLSSSSSTRRKSKKSLSKTLQRISSSDVEQQPSPPPPPPTPVPLVGELDPTSGISIGPGYASGYQGDATSATKRIQSRDRLTVSKEGMRASVASHDMSLQKQFLDKTHTSMSDGEEQLAKRGEFVNSDPTLVAEMNEAVNRYCKEAEQAFNKYVQSATELKVAERKLESLRWDLLNEQHLRHVLGQEEYDKDGRILYGPEEKRLIEQQWLITTELVLERERLAQEKQQLDNCTASLRDAKKQLDNKYQEFLLNEIVEPF